MTISNKYNAGFCVLTITVVGHAQIIWITKKMSDDVSPVSLQDSEVARHFNPDDSYQIGQIESGACNRV
jgi:hypothetical protein